MGTQQRKIGLKQHCSAEQTPDCTVPSPASETLSTIRPPTDPASPPLQSYCLQPTKFSHWPALFSARIFPWKRFHVPHSWDLCCNSGFTFTASCSNAAMQQWLLRGSLQGICVCATFPGLCGFLESWSKPLLTVTYSMHLEILRYVFFF